MIPFWEKEGKPLRWAEAEGIHCQGPCKDPKILIMDDCLSAVDTDIRKEDTK